MAGFPSFAQILGKSAPVIDIVDVGAMAVDGEEPEYAALLAGGNARVIGFEPVQAECDKLNAKARPNRRYLPYFIGDGTERTFYLTNESMTSSLYEPNTKLLKRFNSLENMTRVVQTHQVQTRRLDDIPEITNVDLLKIDIQGAELDAFRGGRRLLKDALVVWTEVEFVPMYKDQPLFGDVDLELRANGFLLHAFLTIGGRAFAPLCPPSGEFNGMNQVLWSDAVFIRNFMDFDDLSAEKLLKLAVICHDQFGSPDLAQLALQHYDRKFKKQMWKLYMTRLTGADPGQPTLPNY